MTHDQTEAMTMADRIGVMNEGALIQLGTPREIYEQPNSAYVASRLGTPAINLIPAALLGSDTVPPHAQTVGLRTEHIRISPADRPGPLAQVHWVEHLGDQNHVHLKLATHSLVTLADPVQELKAGDRSHSSLPNRFISIRPATGSARADYGGTHDGGSTGPQTSV